MSFLKRFKKTKPDSISAAIASASILGAPAAPHVLLRAKTSSPTPGPVTAPALPRPETLSCPPETAQVLSLAQTPPSSNSRASHDLPQPQDQSTAAVIPDILLGVQTSALPTTELSTLTLRKRELAVKRTVLREVAIGLNQCSGVFPPLKAAAYAFLTLDKIFDVRKPFLSCRRC